MSHRGMRTRGARTEPDSTTAAESNASTASSFVKAPRPECTDRRSGMTPQRRGRLTSWLLAIAIVAISTIAMPTMANATDFASSVSLSVATGNSGGSGNSGSHGGGNNNSQKSVTVKAGETLVVTRTTTLSSLTIAAGAAIAAPEGYSLTLTVNGVETGQKLTATQATTSQIAAGTYRGQVVLTVATSTPVVFSGLTFPFRQALYVDATGVVAGKSVSAAVVGGKVTNTEARDVTINSTGEVFNGIYVAAGNYTLVNPEIAFTGNGRSDFSGQGASIIGTGTSTRLVIDGADISNKGVVRAAIIADGGSNVIVKNSKIQTKDGVLAADYQPSVSLAYMQSAPWMLAISGNNRSTNLLGVNTKATYINSSIISENWGALSVDTGQNTQLTAINSTVGNSGKDGYGSYAIGNATERFLGTTFNVATYATIVTGGSIFYGDSTQAAVSELNSSLALGLTAKELAKLPTKNTVIHSKRFGVMWHNTGTVDVSGKTVINSKETTFLNKGQQIGITVNGSQGAKLNPGNGVLLQVMDNDDPGPVPPNMLNTGVYTEPTGPATKVDSFDVTASHSTDAAATFTDIALKGDFYNAIRGGDPRSAGKNLVLNLDHATLSGVVTASVAKHAISTITSAEYQQLGTVTNTAQAVVNNGVIVQLANGAAWTVTGTSHLSKLVVGADSTVNAAAGKTVSMTLDGVQTPIVPGNTYTGVIVLTVGK